MIFKLRFAFFTRGLPFDGSPIETQSIGGSESALHFMARELAKRGHSVEVFCSVKREGVFDGVIYRSNENFERDGALGEWDVFVAHRFVDALGVVRKSKLSWAWLHDMPAGELRTDFAPHLWRADQVVFLSEFHRRAYLKELPELERIAWLSRNGVDLGLIEKLTAGAERKKNLLLYASRPERGLPRLIFRIWPKLLEWNPELQLAISSYDTSGWGHSPEMEQMYAQLDRAIAATPGVTKLGNLNKAEYYRLLATAGAMIYPTSFPEISMINALEAMASGTPIVTTHAFALTETVPYPGVEGHEDRDYDERFVDRVKELLGDELLYRRRQKEGQDHVRGKYPWAQIAREWETRAYEMFRARSQANPTKIFDELVYESDLVAAKEFIRSGAFIYGTSLRAITAADDPEKHPLQAWAEEKLPWLEGILASHHEEPDAYSEGAGEQVNLGWNTNGRFARIASMIPKEAKRVIDVGCGAGGLLAFIHENRKELSLTGIDFSPELIDRARKFHVSLWGGNPVELLCADATTAGGVPYFDCVISSEVLEHQVDPLAFLEGLEKRCKKGGRVILTVPSGPWEAWSFTKVATEAKNDWERNRFHLHHFEQRDLEELLGKKKDVTLQYVRHGYTPRGDQVGWWFVAWTAGKEPFGKIDYARKFATTRPYQKLAACMIVKNEEEGLKRAIRSILEVVDELHVLDTGSTDATKEIVRGFQAEGRYRPEIFLEETAWEDIRPPAASGEHEAEVRCDEAIERLRLIDFSRARNLSTKNALARGADWILWFDGDEFIQGAGNLRKYLHGEFFPSYVIRQMNVNLDAPEKVEVENPYRLFRPGRGLKFYGVIHEQPGFDLNHNPEPALHLPDVRIVHNGYIDPEETRWKCVERNMPLIIKDRYVNEARRLGKLNVLRDYVHLAGFDLGANGGRATERTVDFLRRAVRLYHETFVRDVGNVFYGFATRFYQDALRLLAQIGVEAEEGWGIPFEMQIQLVVAKGGFPENAQTPEPMRRWFACRRDCELTIERDVEILFERMGGVYARPATATAASDGGSAEGPEEARRLSGDALPGEVPRRARDEVGERSAEPPLPDADAEAGRASASE